MTTKRIFLVLMTIIIIAMVATVFARPTPTQDQSLNKSEVLLVIRATYLKRGLDFEKTPTDKFQAENVECSLDMFDVEQKIGVVVLPVKSPNAYRNRRQIVIPEEKDLTSEEILQLKMLKLRGEAFILVIDMDSYTNVRITNRGMLGQKIEKNEDTCIVTKEILRGRLRRQVNQYIDNLLELGAYTPDEERIEKNNDKNELDSFEESLSQLQLEEQHVVKAEHHVSESPPLPITEIQIKINGR